MPKVTAHFSESEFACHDAARTAYPKAWIPKRLLPLCEVLEIVREEFAGTPIEIVSGYRTLAWNTSVGGEKGSKHMEGIAVDFKVSGLDARAVHDVVLRLYQEGKIQIGGLGSYKTFVHVDIRKNKDGRLRRWRF